MREIPQSAGADPLLCALLHVSSFIELSDDETVDLDCAVLAQQGLGLYLERMTSEQTVDVKKQLDRLTKYAKKRAWAKDYIEFVQRYLENFGGHTAKPVKAKKRVPDRKRALRRHVGVDGGDVAAVKKLLETDASLVRADLGDRARPLHCAALNGHTEIVQLLLELGARVNPRNRNRETPLHMAALNGHKGIARLLIEAGADVNARGYKAETPLTQALDYGAGRKAVNLLKKYGATR